MRSSTYTYILLSFFFITNCLYSQPDKSSSIASYIKRSNELGVFNGNILVADQGKIIYKGSWGYADAARQVPLTEQSIFRIGSIAKEFNAVGILMLKEQGKLTLDQKISDFFPELPAWAKTVSVKNLLQYTSGLPDVNWFTVRNEEENWKDLYALPRLEYEPGTGYGYNNNNTFLQRKLIEKISGMKFNDFVQQNILKPCGITKAIIDPKGNEPFMTQSFNRDFKKDTSITTITGWTCLNLEDFYKWSVAVANFKNIGPSSTNEILVPVSPGRQAGLGHGTMKDNKLVTHIHDGSSFSSKALLLTDATTNRTILLMANQKPGDVYEISESLNAILDGKPYPAPRKPILNDYKKQTTEINATTFLSFYQELKKNNPLDYGFDNPNTLNEVGYFFLSEKKQVADAIAVFEFNVALFPDSGYITDSLAEAYYNQGDKKKALYYYKKSLEQGYENPDAKKIIEELEKNLNK